MASLTKKTAQLSDMSHDVLVNIIHDPIQDNKQARTTLVNGYLLSPAEVLKAVEKEYARGARSKRFYDYYDADAFFGRDADLLIVVNSEIPADDLIVHFF